MLKYLVRLTIPLAVMIFDVLLVFPSDFQGRTPKGNGRIADYSILTVYDERNSKTRLNAPNTIFQDHEGRIWIANLYGIHVYDENSTGWMGYNEGNGTFVSRAVYTIAETKGSKIWFAPDYPWVLPDSSVTWFDGSNWGRLHWPSSYPNWRKPLSCVFGGPTGKIWFGLGSDVVGYDGLHWDLPLVLSKTSNTSVPNQRETRPQIRAGLQDQNGYLWLASSSSILKYHLETSEYDQYSQNSISDISRIYEDRTNRLWFSNVEGRIMVCDKEISECKAYELVSKVPPQVERQLRRTLNDRLSIGLTGIYQDKSGRMLFTSLYGLMRYSERENTWEFFTMENSDLTGNAVTSILEDRTGRLWLGTNTGILVLDQ
jgi:ligand-binding sensor domain-containing protein